MPQNIEMLLENASELVSLDEFDEALLIYDKILTVNPKNVYALIDKAITLQRIGKNYESIKLFNRALKIQPKNVDGLIGFQFFNQDNDNSPGTGTTAFIPNYNTNRWSLFLLETKKIGKSFIEAGIRLDNEKNNVRGRELNQNIFRDEYTFNNITLSLGYENEVSEKFSIRSNFGSAWRTPDMAELFSYGGHSFKNTFGLLRYYYNSSDRIMTDKIIKMEEGTISAEKGFKFINEINFNSERQKVKVTFFSNYILNYVFERPIGIYGTIRGPMPYFIYDQSDVFFLGSDISLERKISENIKSTSTFNYLWSKNLKKNDKIINQPPIKISNNFVIKTKQFWNIPNLTSFHIIGIT